MSNQTGHTDDPEVHAHVAHDFERQLARIVSDLRTIADKVERVTSPEPDQETPGFGIAAGMVVAELMNMVPNLGISGLVRSASEADTTLLQFRLRPLPASTAASGLDPRVVIGSTVRDLLADSDEVPDTGIVVDTQEGGYSVIWDLGPGAGTSGKGVYVAADEVEFVLPDGFER